MERRFLIYFFAFILILSSFVYAASTDDILDSAKSLENTKDSIDNAIDNPRQEFDRVLDKTKAEERIEKINSYIGPITKVLWGYEFSLSWKFIIAFLLWILLIELIVVPSSEIFKFNTLASLGVAGIIATIAMQGIGKDLVVFIDSLINVWWAGLFAIFTALIFGAIYQIAGRSIGKWVEKQKELSKKEKLERNLAVIDANARSSELELKENLGERRYSRKRIEDHSKDIEMRKGDDETWEMKK